MLARHVVMLSLWVEKKKQQNVYQRMAHFTTTILSFLFHTDFTNKIDAVAVGREKKTTECLSTNSTLHNHHSIIFVSYRLHKQNRRDDNNCHLGQLKKLIHSIMIF
jgi:hypothetical protein